MEGKDEPAELRGIMPNTFHYVFEQIAKESESSRAHVHFMFYLL